MKNFFLTLATLCFLSGTVPAFAQGGHYKNGKGSSHKGGKYKNKATGNHYRKRK